LPWLFFTAITPPSGPYLHTYLNLPVDHLHTPTHRLEHITDDGMRQSLEEGTDRVGHDHRSRPISPEKLRDPRGRSAVNRE
jgi:hypothetical protein